MKTSARIAVMALGGLAIAGGIGDELARMIPQKPSDGLVGITQAARVASDTKFITVGSMLRGGDTPFYAARRLPIPLLSRSRTPIARRRLSVPGATQRSRALAARLPRQGTFLVPVEAPVARQTMPVSYGSIPAQAYDATVVEPPQRGVRGFIARFGHRLHQRWLALRGGGG